MIEKVCKWCNETIIVEKNVSYASHVGNCKSNPNFIKKFATKGISLVERITIQKDCPRCNNKFELTGTEKELNSKKVRKYCSIFHIYAI